MKMTKVTLWGDHLVEGEEISVRDITDYIAKIPQEYLSSAALRVGHTEYAVPLEISYTRPETDADRQKRERDEAEYAAKMQRSRYERDLAEYTRLKAKFEGKQ